MNADAEHEELIHSINALALLQSLSPKLLRFLYHAISRCLANVISMLHPHFFQYLLRNRQFPRCSQAIQISRSLRSVSASTDSVNDSERSPAENTINVTLPHEPYLYECNYNNLSNGDDPRNRRGHGLLLLPSRAAS
jgi:hypothetical protein